MNTETTITKGMTLYYKMIIGEKIFKRVVKDISPNGKCFLVDDNDGKGELWIAAASIVILDTGKST